MPLIAFLTSSRKAILLGIRRKKSSGPEQIEDYGDADKAVSRNAPPAASNTEFPRSAAFYERYARPILDRNRLMIIVVLEALALVAMGIALASIAPLKTVVPYLVQVHNNGSVEVSNALKSGPWTPGKASLTYWLGKWTRELLTIDGPQTQKQLQTAYGIVRGNAVSEFISYAKANQPVSQAAKNPNLSQTVTINNLTFVQPNLALVHLVVHKVDSNRNIDAKRRLLLTITYGIKPPQSRSELYKNPLGIYVTNFIIQNSDGN